MKYLIGFLFFLIYLNCSSQENIDMEIIDSCNFYINKGQQGKAIKILTKLEKTFTLKKNYKDQFKTYHLLGKAMYDLGDRNQASIFYEKGLELAKRINDSLIIADFYMYLAGVNIHGNGKLGLHQLNLAEDIYFKLHNKQRLSLIKYKKGVHYCFGSVIDSVNYYFNQVIDEAKKNGER